MLLPRLIPCLLLHEKGLVKTLKFGDPKYVGDPINAVRIFNEKQVDELVVLDIDATVEDKEPDYKLIAKLAAECRMPLCYGGGVKTVESAKRILSLGVEKVALSSILFENPQIAVQLADEVGSQSVVAVLDVKKKRFGSQYDIYTHNGTKNTGYNLSSFFAQFDQDYFGEIVINSIDRDGGMSGYDLSLATKAKQLVQKPLTILGGVGSMADIQTLINKYPIIGAAAGSYFVFKGKYRAVLISYPSQEEKKALMQKISMES